MIDSSLFLEKPDDSASHGDLVRAAQVLPMPILSGLLTHAFSTGDERWARALVDVGTFRSQRALDVSEMQTLDVRMSNACQLTGLVVAAENEEGIWSARVNASQMFRQTFEKSCRAFPDHSAWARRA